MRLAHCRDSSWIRRCFHRILSPVPPSTVLEVVLERVSIRCILMKPFTCLENFYATDIKIIELKNHTADYLTMNMFNTQNKPSSSILTIHTKRNTISRESRNSGYEDCCFYHPPRCIIVGSYMCTKVYMKIVIYIYHEGNKTVVLLPVCAS